MHPREDSWHKSVQNDNCQKCWAQRNVILRVFALKMYAWRGTCFEPSWITMSYIKDHSREWKKYLLVKSRENGQVNLSQIKWKGLLTSCRATVLKIILTLILTTSWVCCVICGRASVGTWCGATPAKPIKIIITRHIEPSTHACLEVTITWRWAYIIQ